MRETATAVTAMTEDAQSVRAAAEEVDGQAGAVQRRAKDLGDAVGGLRQSVVRVIRTSTAEVDRRNTSRPPVNLQGRFIPDGAPARAVSALDLSEQGSLLRCEGAAPPVGSGRLSLPGLDIAARVIRSAAQGEFSVAFEPEEAQRAVIARLIGAHRRRPRPHEPGWGERVVRQDTELDRN